MSVDGGPIRIDSTAADEVDLLQLKRIWMMGWLKSEWVGVVPSYRSSRA